MQAVMNAPMRMQLERVVDLLEAQPWDKDVPVQHMTAYKYLRTLAQEIASINQAHVSSHCPALHIWVMNA